MGELGSAPARCSTGTVLAGGVCFDSPARRTPSGAFAVSPAQVQRDDLGVGRERNDRFAEPFGLGGDQAAACGAGQAEPLIITVQEDLTIEESVVEVLTGGPH